MDKKSHGQAKKKFFLKLILCMCMPVHLGAVRSEARRGRWLPHGLGTELKPSERAASVLNCGAISPPSGRGFSTASMLHKLLLLQE